jgi:hypothetical protein
MAPLRLIAQLGQNEVAKELVVRVVANVKDIGQRDGSPAITNASSEMAS